MAGCGRLVVSLTRLVLGSIAKKCDDLPEVNKYIMAQLATPLSWIEISQTALRHNLREIRKVVGSTVQIFPCVKANAYGHGVAYVAQAMIESGVAGFSVAEFEEACSLREQNVTHPIRIMSPLPDAHLHAAANADLWVWVHDLPDAQRVIQGVKDCAKSLNVVVKVDTGMGRFGAALAEVEELLQFIQKSNRVQVVSVATHFATADLADALFVSQQEGFAQSKRLATRVMGDTPLRFQSANSAALLREAQTPGAIVRPGLAVYGYWPAPTLDPVAAAQQVSLRPVLAWKTRLLQIKRLPAGANVGYGGRTRLEKPTLVGTIPVGYAHGLDRRLSQRGTVLVGGKQVALLGNICMNVAMVDVSAVDDVQVGDEVVLIGKQGAVTQSAADLAQAMGAIVYEVLVQLSPAIERRLIE